MRINKYEKINGNKYKLFLDNGQVITLYEDVILDNKLLFKNSIESLDKIIKDNDNYDIYYKCVKYILIRLRSINEVKEYLKRKNIEEEFINVIINKLLGNKLLNDELFTKAFINDKLKFSTMGEYKIAGELNNHHIDNNIINKYISLIDEDIIREKINKLINKNIKSNKKYKGILLKDKIYKYLLGLGYKSESIIQELNNYNF